MSQNTIPPFHQSYLENIYMWQICRDTIVGEQKVKERKTRYLPMPASMAINGNQNRSNINLQDTDYGFLPDNGNPISNLMMKQISPNYHQNQAYQAYLTRAQFPELPSFILRGLLGITSNEKPTIKLPKSMEYLLSSATTTGLSLNEYYLYVLAEVLSVGRLASVIEIDENGKLIFATYVAESMVNWKLSRVNGSSRQQPSMVMLAELIDTNPQGIMPKNETIYKTLLIDEESGTYYVRQLTAEEASSEGPVKDLGKLSGVPEYLGKKFNKIPISVFGPISNSFAIQNSPMASIASTSVQIYMKYADLSNSEFMSCSPTLVISGVDDEFAPKAVGSNVALILPNHEAKAYYTVTDTSALVHVSNHIGDLYEQAIYNGAQLLDSSKKAAESAETTRLKQASSGATLSSVVRNSALGIEQQLKDIAIIMGEDPNDIRFSAVTDFSAPALTANELKALVESWTAGAISHPTLLENFRRGGILHDGESSEDEILRIQSAIIKPSSYNIISNPSNIK